MGNVTKGKSQRKTSKNAKKPKLPNKTLIKVKQYSEENMAAALRDVRLGKPVATAAKEHSVPRTTLFYKFHGILPENKRMGAPTILSTEDEEILVNWIQKSADAGFPISKKNFLHSVKKLADELGKQFPGKGNLPGKKWLSSFLNRHPDVSFRTSQNLTSSRASVTKKNLEDWFKEVYDYLEKKNLTDCLKDPNKVFNGDESAFFLSPKGDKVLARKGDKTVYNKIGSNEKECETVMITGNAAGDLAPPLVIFQYQRLPYEIAQNLPIGWGIGTSDSGWNTSDVFYCYMANVFYPWAKQNKDIRFKIYFSVSISYHYLLYLYHEIRSKHCKI